MLTARHAVPMITLLLTLPVLWLGGCGEQSPEASMRGEQITADDLRALADETHVEWLDLSETNVTDEMLEIIAGIDHIKSVDLSRTDVTDDGLAVLARRKNWHGLHLVGTQITDAGLAHLEGMSELNVLMVAETGVTPKGMAKLLASNPSVMADVTPPMKKPRMPLGPQQ